MIDFVFYYLHRIFVCIACFIQVVCFGVGGREIFVFSLF
jgi:hypothetical protein